MDERKPGGDNASTYTWSLIRERHKQSFIERFNTSNTRSGSSWIELRSLVKRALWKHAPVLLSTNCYLTERDAHCISLRTQLTDIFWNIN